MERALTLMLLRSLEPTVCKRKLQILGVGQWHNQIGPSNEGARLSLRSLRAHGLVASAFWLVLSQHRAPLALIQRLSLARLLYSILVTAIRPTSA